MQLGKHACGTIERKLSSSIVFVAQCNEFETIQGENVYFVTWQKEMIFLFGSGYEFRAAKCLPNNWTTKGANQSFLTLHFLTFGCQCNFAEALNCLFCSNADDFDWRYLCWWQIKDTLKHQHYSIKHILHACSVWIYSGFMNAMSTHKCVSRLLKIHIHNFSVSFGVSGMEFVLKRARENTNTRVQSKMINWLRLSQVLTSHLHRL